MTPKEVLELTKKNNVAMVNLLFVDFPGVWQNLSVPIGQLGESSFEEGFGFDGSSIRGWQAINASDMLLLPDASSAFIDPFRTHTTLNLICNILDPITKESYSRDPRYIAMKAVNYLRST
ncbi:MAG: glutamine synthetase beta-grasp domain-containing protein, partial [Nitrospirae bacterium]|nr:glutamine synthetase beta-grasp domain-containing protein [Nitrospirota bacterium]